MAKVIWSPKSLDDIDLIAEYIARDSPRRASLFVDRLIKAVERLKTFPQSGRMIPEIRDEVRRVDLFLRDECQASTTLTGKSSRAKLWLPACISVCNCFS